MDTNRRILIKALGLFMFFYAFFSRIKVRLFKVYANEENEVKIVSKRPELKNTKIERNLGVETDGKSYVYIARGAKPEDNTKNAIEMVGGIEKFIGKTDIVILKPNAQWWNQGMTNTDSMKAFIDLVLEIPGFKGEIIIAENQHFIPADSRGWTTKERNGKFNLNELVDHYKNNGYQNVTKYHWRDGGKNILPLQGDDGGNGIVKGPGGKDGYVWREDIVYRAPNGRKCLMTYPVFTSAYSNIQIDLKNGPWQSGKYLDIPIKLINFSALNHHSIYSGATGAIKNYMGIVDMTCGFPGPEPKGTYNTHYIGVSKFMKHKKIVWQSHWRIAKFLYRNFRYTGGSLGFFMNHVRMADLNVITAERVGWRSRTDLEGSVHTKAIVVSKDPVAIDLIASEKILSESTPVNEAFLKSLNNGFSKNGPFWKFIKECHLQGIGNIEKDKIHIEWFDV
ncbi:MAG: DUF362 domain-containing protein [Desulfobacteraceae bacterium]|nr:DUF362 domain-containing protein [Desulfobacteraceae bacterium]MBC2749223.1 DUF362 domain-containing protein [Desulfobacteraceae bacterium]